MVEPVSNTIQYFHTFTTVRREEWDESGTDGTPPPVIGLKTPDFGVKTTKCYIKLGIRQLMAGGGVALIGTTLVPLLSGLFG